MQLLNFTLGGQYIDLEWPDGGYADLHNDYDFDQLIYTPAKAKLTLIWQKSSGEWAKHAQAKVLRLLFDGVSYLHVKARGPEYPVSEDKYLRDICRTPPEVRANFDDTYVDRNPPAEYDLQLVFQSEWGIKVNADTVLLALE